MPYAVKSQGKRWAIVNKQTGKVVGTSSSKKMAEASVRARMSAESKKKGK
jgi:hypothetical protein